MQWSIILLLILHLHTSSTCVDLFLFLLNLNYGFLFCLLFFFILFHSFEFNCFELFLLLCPNLIPLYLLRCRLWKRKLQPSVIEVFKDGVQQSPRLGLELEYAQLEGFSVGECITDDLRQMNIKVVLLWVITQLG